MPKPPAFQLYTRDVLSSSAVWSMSLAARGAYWFLLCYQWQDGYVVDDDLVIAKLLGCTPRRWRQVRDPVRSRFQQLRLSDIEETDEEHDVDILVNTKLQDQRTTMTRQHLKSVKGGNKSAAKRRIRLTPKSNQGSELGVNTASATASATAEDPPPPPQDDAGENIDTTSLEATAGRLVEFYRNQHQQLRGVPYHGKPTLDYQAALGVCRSFDDLVLLAQMVVAWLKDDNPNDEFLNTGTRSLTKFASRASFYAERVQQAEFFKGPEADRDVWQEVLERLGSKLSRHVIYEWFTGSKLVSWDAESGNMVVSFPPGRLDYVRGHYIDKLFAIAGTEVHLELVEEGSEE